jgi:hypothetical protein
VEERCVALEEVAGRGARCERASAAWVNCMTQPICRQDPTPYTHGIRGYTEVIFRIMSLYSAAYVSKPRPCCWTDLQYHAGPISRIAQTS